MGILLGFTDHVLKSLCCPCAEAAEAGMEAIVAEAHTFLHEQGCINVGVPRGEPSKTEAAEDSGISDEELAEAVFDIVEDADFDVRNICPSYPPGPA